VNSCPIGTTPPVKRRNETSLSTLRCSTIGSAGIRPLASSPRPSTKRGRRWLNPVSTELGEGHDGTTQGVGIQTGRTEEALAAHGELALLVDFPHRLDV
jgi:hypothetical protein